MVTRRVTGTGNSTARLRANGPRVCLAQANGLGFEATNTPRANGPALYEQDCQHQVNGRAVGPYLWLGVQVPSPMDWAMQTAGPLARSSMNRGQRLLLISSQQILTLAVRRFNPLTPSLSP